MGSNIRRLDGSVVELGHLPAKPEITALLRKLAAKNRRGRIMEIAVVSISPEGWLSTHYRWGDAVGAAPSRLSLLTLTGALSFAAAELAAELRDGPVMSES